MSNDVAEIEEFGKRWVKAELDGDTGAMDSLAHNDFCWSGRWASFWIRPSGWSVTSGAFVTSALDWRDTTVRVFGDSAVVIGVHDQQAAYRGQPNNGQFRATHILIREDGTWRLVGMHLSPIATPPAGPQQDR